MKMVSPLFYLFIFLMISCSEEKKTEISEENKTEKKEVELHSDITCPSCGFTKNEAMPTEQCMLRYTCTKCNIEMYAQEGDCCVFCSYGTVKCPSVEEAMSEE